jgi:hypothetical protein
MVVKMPSPMTVYETHLKEVCRYALGPGHAVQVCRLKSHKPKVTSGHLLFDLLHSRGQLRRGQNLSAIAGTIWKAENGSESAVRHEAATWWLGCVCLHLETSTPLPTGALLQLGLGFTDLVA